MVVVLPGNLSIFTGRGSDQIYIKREVGRSSISARLKLANTFNSLILSKPVGEVKASGGT